MKINKDFKAFKNGSMSKSSFAILMNPCFWAVILYRISNWLYKRKLTVIAKLIWLINRIVIGVDIDYRAEIGKGLVIVHGLGIVIGCNVRMGSYVKIYQGVTLGGNCGRTRQLDSEIISQPIIGDNVIIYANSMVVGPVIVGDNCCIPAMKFIDKDFNIFNSNK